MTPHLRDWQPPDGLLSDYVNFWLPTSDAPRVYHVACGLAVLAATVENRVYLPFGGDRLLLNVWAVILGPSSFYRKSSSITKARKILQKLSDGDGPGPLLPDEFSREALLKRLSERAQGLLTYSEFSGALAQFSRDYMSGTIQLLADLYDSPETYSRIVGQQSWTLRNTCLSVLAASQTDWFIEKIKQSDLRGGFLARFTYWPAFEKARFIAVPPEPDRERGRQLLAGLNSLRQCKGEITLLPSVHDTYARWVEGHERQLHKSKHVGELSPFWSRLSITTLKLAGLLQLSMDRRLAIGSEALESAIGLSEFLKSALAHLFAEEFAFTKPMQDRQKLLRLIRNRPGISRRDLLRASSLLVRDFDPVLSTLRQEEQIEQRDGGFWPLESSAESAPVSDGDADAVRPMITRVK